MTGTARRLKRAIIREELVALTGDTLSALILNQFLYWSERVRDFDKFIAEEKKRDPGLQMPPTHGWIYKTAAQLREEIMSTASESTISRRLQGLVRAGILWRRRNPEYKWDRTWQYRVNLECLRDGLAGLGYPLGGWRFVEQGGLPEASDSHLAASITQGDESTVHPARAIPEITTEITDIVASLPSGREGKDSTGVPVEDAPQKRRRRAPDPRSDSPAIQAFRSVVKRYPKKALYDVIIEALGETPDLKRLSSCYCEWLERGYNGNSYKWLTEWYTAGVPAKHRGARASPVADGSESMFERMDRILLEDLGNHGDRGNADHSVQDIDAGVSRPRGEMAPKGNRSSRDETPLLQIPGGP